MKCNQLCQVLSILSLAAFAHSLTVDPDDKLVKVRRSVLSCERPRHRTPRIEALNPLSKPANRAAHASNFLARYGVSGSAAVVFSQQLICHKEESAKCLHDTVGTC